MKGLVALDFNDWLIDRKFKFLENGFHLTIKLKGG